jgi:hypothetical protein
LSATSGRQIPALAGGISTANWALTGTSTGVRSYYYYHNTYSLSYFRVWQSGELWWGKVKSGFGVGAFYYEREFRDEGTAPKKDQDFGLGPAFQVRWFPLGPVYFNMEVIFGLRDIFANLLMNGQNLVTFSLGVEI